MLQAFLFVLGTIFGSFFNVCIYRLPKDIGLNKNSSCTSCKKKINYYHNIPIFSYLFLKGRCSNCKKKISIFYPIVELITGLTFLISYRIYGISYEFIFFIIFYSSLLIIFFTDLNEFLILDKVSLPIGYLGLITSAIELNPFKIIFIESLVGAIVGYLLIFSVIRFQTHQYSTSYCNSHSSTFQPNTNTHSTTNPFSASDTLNSQDPTPTISTTTLTK